MRLHCPHCQGSFERSHLSGDEAILCPRCGEGFELSSKNTVLYVSQSPSNPQGDRKEGLAPLAKGDRLGGFVLEEKVGEGGMGVVFRGTQLSLGKTVAIKALPPGLSENPEFVRRFGREAKALAALNHPNIVSIIDKGFERGHYFFVMEFVDGVSLRTLLREDGFVPQRALQLVPEICSALEYAHEQGLVHRDIKPENILIDTAGRVKIADFGLSKIVHGDTVIDGITRTNVTVGTVEYMAPEQRIQSRDVDHRADLYSLGVILYEMLTGELPLGRFEDPSLKCNLSADIDPVVLKALEKDPERRYQRASEVAEDLQRCSGVNTLPSVPTPPSPPLGQFRRFRSWVIEHRGMLFVTAIFCLVATPLVPLWLVIWGLSALSGRRKRLARSPSTRKTQIVSMTGSLESAKAPSMAIGAFAFSLVVATGSILLHLMHERVLEIYLDQERTEMLRMLFGVALSALPGIILVLLANAAVRRAKLFRRPGRWIGRFAFLVGLFSLSQIATLWSELEEEYAFWTHIERRLTEDSSYANDLFSEVQETPHHRRTPRKVRLLVAADPTISASLLRSKGLPIPLRVAVVRGLARSQISNTHQQLSQMIPLANSPEVRIALLEEFASLSPKDAPTNVIQILPKLEGMDEYRAAIKTLSTLYTRGAIESLEVLVRLLSDERLNFANAAAQALLSIETPNIVKHWAHVALLKSLNRAVRLQAIRALGNRDQPTARQALVGLLEDPEPMIRSSALSALVTRFRKNHGFDPTLGPDLGGNPEALKLWREEIEAVDRSE